MPETRNHTIRGIGWRQSMQPPRPIQLVGREGGGAIGNGRCFIFRNSKGITNKIPQHGTRQRKMENKADFSPYCGGEITIS